MPLAFQSLSHGEVTFGFFNIETDMVMLDRYFMFAEDFCDHMAGLAGGSEGAVTTGMNIYILRQAEIGNLIGAISGIDFRGFIGETYKLFPFPGEGPAFKQNPDGFKTRETMIGLISKYAGRTWIPVVGDSSGAAIAIGSHVFTQGWFHEILKYLWKGGFPGWKDEVRPAYVRHMKEAVEKSTHPLFGLTFS